MDSWVFQISATISSGDFTTALVAEISTAAAAAGHSALTSALVSYMPVVAASAIVFVQEVTFTVTYDASIASNSELLDTTRLSAAVTTS